MVVGGLMRLFGLFLVVGVLGIAPAVAEDMPPPFELSDDFSRRSIPKGLGMRFFEGKWFYIGSGFMLPMTVTDKAFVNDDTGVVEPYRVLVEARNYVLLAVLVQPYVKGEHRIPWTNFAVLTLRHDKGENPYSVYANMAYHSCNHESMDGGDHALSWSKEKLMRVFRDSCLPGIVSKYGFPFGEGWNGSRYQRQ